MNKKEMEILEKAFVAEINGRLPFQSKSALAKKLAVEGMLDEYTETTNTQLGTLTIRGYSLTHLGRLCYCCNCETPT